MPSNSSTSIQYREISEFPGYRVGDDGSAWSNRVRGGHGKWVVGPWWQLSPGRDRSGHLSVGLRRDGKTYHRFVHTLVLQAFVGPCPPGMECRHFPDRDPANNRLENLQWGTRGQNIADMVPQDTHHRGERSPNAKLSQADVETIRLAKQAGQLQNALARQFGVSTALISVIVNHKAWRHLP